MPFVLGDLDAIDKAIKSGTQSVDFPDGGSVSYRSMSDLLKARETILSDLQSQGVLPAPGGGGSANGSGATSQSLAETSRE